MALLFEITHLTQIFFEGVLISFSVCYVEAKEV